MSKPYCGVRKVPKGSRRGTMKECLSKGQTRYYGLEKMNKNLYELYLNQIKQANLKANKKRQEAKKKEAEAKKAKLKTNFLTALAKNTVTPNLATNTVNQNSNKKPKGIPKKNPIDKNAPIGNSEITIAQIENVFKTAKKKKIIRPRKIV